MNKLNITILDKKYKKNHTIFKRKEKLTQIYFHFRPLKISNYSLK